MTLPRPEAMTDIMRKFIPLKDGRGYLYAVYVGKSGRTICFRRSKDKGKTWHTFPAGKPQRALGKITEFTAFMKPSGKIEVGYFYDDGPKP